MLGSIGIANPGIIYPIASPCCAAIIILGSPGIICGAIIIAPGAARRVVNVGALFWMGFNHWLLFMLCPPQRAFHASPVAAKKGDMSASELSSILQQQMGSVGSDVSIDEVRTAPHCGGLTNG